MELTDKALKEQLEDLQKNLVGKTKEEIEVQIKALVEKSGFAYHAATEEKFKEVTDFNEQLKKDLDEANETIVKLDGKLAETATKKAEENQIKPIYWERLTLSIQILSAWFVL